VNASENKERRRAKHQVLKTARESAREAGGGGREGAYGPEMRGRGNKRRNRAKEVRSWESAVTTE